MCICGRHFRKPIHRARLFRKGSGIAKPVESDRYNLPYGLFIISIFAIGKIGSSAKLFIRKSLNQPYSPGRLFAHRDGLLDKLRDLALLPIMQFHLTSLGLSQIVINNARSLKKIVKTIALIFL